MYLADYHMHSRVSPDARFSMIDMARACIDAGLQEICFTDHVETMLWGEDRRLSTTPTDTYDWAPMAAEYAAVREELGDRLTIRLGAELGDIPVGVPLAESIMSAAPELDFLIASVHALSPKFGYSDMSRHKAADEAGAYAVLEDYLALAQQTAEWGKFSVMGHLTLPVRYLNDRQGFHVDPHRMEEQIRCILRTLIDKGCGIELNTNHGMTPLPDASWLQIYRELGGEIITIGSDAHRPEGVGCAVRESQELLRAIGFRYFCTFEKRKPVFHQL